MNVIDSNSIALQQQANVSRETLDRLMIYPKLLEKWNSRINLVARSTISNAWDRHFVDSAQLWRLRPEFQNWVDIGSGAGFPGLVLAIIAAELAPEAKFHLVESDARKCAFLRTVAREVDVTVNIFCCRIGDLDGIVAEVVSARALAPLIDLLEYSEKILKFDGHCLFLKGHSCDIELTKTANRWNFELDRFPSVTDPQSSVLRLRGIERVGIL